MDKLALGIALATSLSGGVAAAQETLVAKGATWRYLDDGSDQGSAWVEPGFPDVGWAAGPAVLGYGDDDVVTEVSYGPFEFLKFITTYFRRSFTVADPDSYTSLELRLKCDDGAVVYINGVEVARDNMLPLVTPAFTHWALSDVNGSDEDIYAVHVADASSLVTGTNVIAVEVHQFSPFSSDISLDLEVLASTEAAVTRGPYLNLATPTGVTVRWRTDVPTASEVRWGSAPGVTAGSVVESSYTTEHEVRVEGLSPGTRYYYTVGKGGDVLAGGDAEHYFQTAPPAGSATPFRAWVIGDSGTANSDAAAVRDAYAAHTGDTHTDLWLMLGDNAYSEGTDEEYQVAVFDMYPGMLRTSPLFPTRGNHEILGGPYYAAFTMPTAAEAGGVPSGTEEYYSYDWANVHFVVLESFIANPLPAGAQYTWLSADLQATEQDWIVAYWHHPPYSKGSHDSDEELDLALLRAVWLPLLEEHGVDLVLCGHSHAYERSFLLDGHYGFSGSFEEGHKKDPGDGRIGGDGAYQKAPLPHAGTAYVVAGSSGKTSGGTFDHPAMYHAVPVLGSVVLDVDGDRLDLSFLTDTGVVEDHFTLLKFPGESLSGDTTTVSVSSGGAQAFSLDAGSAHAGRPYLLLGSTGGTEPGTPLDGVVLPLVVDAYTLYTLSGANGPVLQGSFGFLDGQGRASAGWVLPPGAAAGSVGLHLVHAFLAFDVPGTGAAKFASDAFPLTLLP